VREDAKIPLVWVFRQLGHEFPLYLHVHIGGEWRCDYAIIVIVYILEGRGGWMWDVGHPDLWWFLVGSEESEAYCIGPCVENCHGVTGYGVDSGT
jgi:hypothetical protein